MTYGSISERRRLGSRARTTRIVGVTASDSGGREITARAGVYVLAAGGIENARLLLKLRSDGCSARGVGTQLLGKTFMEHVHAATAVLVPQEDALFDATHGHSWHECNGTPIQWKHRLSEAVVRAESIGQYCFCLWPTRIDLLPDRLRAATSKAADGGRRVFVLEVMSEQVPNPASQVDLSDLPLVGLDRRHGTQARLRWHLDDLDWRTLSVGQRVAVEEIERLGIGKVIPGLDARTVRSAVWTGHHHMGTTRMSETPTSGVVDPNGLVHGTSNLYVAGASVFPTGGFANPTLTALALSDRLATHIAGHSPT